MDLNVIVEVDGAEVENVHDVIQRSYDLGYECIALNTIVHSKNLCGKNTIVPEPKHIEFETKFAKKFRILNRLTAVIEEPIHAHHLLKCPITKKYDILSIQPDGEKLLQHIISSVDVDLISLNFSEALGYTLKKAHVGPAFQKGLCFEISYAPCLRSQHCRRSIISNSQLLVDVCKGKNIIVSSGAMKPLELRSPEDVANFGVLFGFKSNQAVESVRRTGNTVIKHAGTRKNTGCGFVSITGILKVPKQQGWIVKMCKVPPPLSKEPPASKIEGKKRKLEKLLDSSTGEKHKKNKVGHTDE